MPGRGWKVATLLYGCLIGCMFTSTFYFAISGIFGDREANLQSLQVEIQMLEDDARPSTARKSAPPGDGFASVAGLSIKKEKFEAGIEKIVSFNSPVSGGLGQHATIEAEYQQRRTLLVAVLASRKEAENSAAQIEETWGAKRTSDCRIFVSTVTNEVLEGYPAIVSIPGRSVATGNKLRMETSFKLLKHLQYHYARSYDWFLIVPPTTFVSLADVEDILRRLDPNTIVYMGRPSSNKPLEMAQRRLMANELFCEAGPGIILSRAALAAIYPHLNICLKSVERFGMASWPDIELGRCFSRKVGIRCSSSAEVLRYFIHDAQNESLHWEKLHYSPHLYDLVTLHPVHNVSHMSLLHQYCINRRKAKLQREISAIEQLRGNRCKRQSITGISVQLNCSVLNLNAPANSMEPTVKLATKSVLHRFYPGSKYELKPWSFVDSMYINVPDTNNPAVRIMGDDQIEINYIIKNAVDILSQQDHVEYKHQKLEGGYIRYSGLLGKEFILDLSLSTQDSVLLMRRRIRLQRHHLSELTALLDRRENIHTVRTNFIVPLSNVGTRFADFLIMYEELCLKPLEKCRLVLAVYGNQKEKQLIMKKLQAYQEQYPHFEYIVASSKERFSRAKALDLAMTSLNANELAFLCDVDMSIDVDFLNRCKLNTIMGQRVYYPIFFKYYNMDYVYRFKRRPATLRIKREHGHWASYSYGMLCIYKSDYLRVGGFDKSIEGWGGEDIDLLNRILKDKLDVLRSPDPALRHRYHDKVCSRRLNPVQLSTCISSRSEGLADRMQLANYVFYLEETCGINARTLW